MSSQQNFRNVALGSLLLIITLLVLAAYALIITANPAQAQSAVLVSNTGQTSETGGVALDNTVQSHAQGFNTGTNDDGYTLHSIGFKFHNISDTSTASADLQMTLNEDNSGAPGDALCTLTDPTSFTASGVHTFDAPSTGVTCPILRRNPDAARPEWQASQAAGHPFPNIPKATKLPDRRNP